MTGIGRMLIPVQGNYLHHLGQTWTCHCWKIGSAMTAALMTLRWGRSISLQLSPCLVARCKSEDVWSQRNSFVTCRPRQRHYFRCPCTSPSGGGASWVHGSTTRWVSFSSQLRRQRRGPSCPSFPKWVTASYRLTNIHGLKSRRVPRLNILLFI